MKLTEQQIIELEQQLSCPEGEKGIEVGKTMNESNIKMTLKSIDYLEFQDKDTILEFGHGNCGHLSHIFQQANQLKYFGLEVSETMFKEALKNRQSYLAEFKLYDGNNIPYPNDFFDKIFCVNTIYFWENPLTILQEIERVLKPNGACVLTYANKTFMKQLPFVRQKFELYDTSKLKELLHKTNLRILETKELKEEVISKSGEFVNRISSLVKIGYNFTENH